MNKFIVILLISLFSFGYCYANEDFLGSIKNHKIVFAFNDGTVNELTFDTNKYNVTTGILEDEKHITVSNLIISFHTDSAGNEWMKLFKDTVSPIGTYKYAIEILIPVPCVSGQSQAYVDLRWGFWRNPVIFIENL